MFSPTAAVKPWTAERIARATREAVRLLAARPGVCRVWLFGSAAHRRDRMDARSDLDLAVEGLEHSELFSAWGELDDALRCPVDLVRWEEASPALRSQITGRGVLLYPRQASAEVVP